MKQRGWDYKTAKEHLESQLRADAKHLSAAIPDVTDEISAALQVADEAKQCANDLLAEKNAVLDQIENLVISLARCRWRVSKIQQQFILNESAEQTLAKTVLETFLENTERPTPNAESRFQVRYSALAKLGRFWPARTQPGRSSRHGN